jgi:protein MpaA
MIKIQQTVFTIVIITASLFFSGCTSSLKSGKEKLVNRCSEPVNVYPAGTSTKGKPITYTKLGNGENVTLLYASIHGSERAGTPILKRFQNYLLSNCELLDGKTVIIIPVVNPDGFVKKTRHNANNIDLNRNFPAANRENNKNGGSFALSEIESYELYKIINIYKPSKILAFHEALNCIDYDGPAEELAKRLADKCKLPLKKVGARPGSLGSYVGLELNKQIITVEMTKEDSKASEVQLWRDYKDMLIEAINY